MKVAAVVLLVVASGYCSVSVPEISITNYHEKIGVPRAASIKAYEQQVVKDGTNQRIVGGNTVDIIHFPFQAGLIITLVDGRQSVCGGSIISNTRILTAAHCQFDGRLRAQSFNVVVGSNMLFSGGIRFQTRDVVMHPQWNPATTANDIAIIRFPAITLSLRVQHIDLPTAGYATNNLIGRIVAASGFGWTHDGAGIGPNQRLSAVNLPIINNSVCSAAYGSNLIRNSQICTSGDGGRNICRGDSGGPLVLTTGNRRVLIGVTSFGAYASCMIGLPAVSTRVPSYLSWIRSI